MYKIDKFSRYTNLRRIKKNVEYNRTIMKNLREKEQYCNFDNLIKQNSTAFTFEVN